MNLIDDIAKAIANRIDYECSELQGNGNLINIDKAVKIIADELEAAAVKGEARPESDGWYSFTTKRLEASKEALLIIDDEFISAKECREYLEAQEGEV